MKLNSIVVGLALSFSAFIADAQYTPAPSTTNTQLFGTNALPYSGGQTPVNTGYVVLPVYSLTNSVVTNSGVAVFAISNGVVTITNVPATLPNQRSVGSPMSLLVGVNSIGTNSLNTFAFNLWSKSGNRTTQYPLSVTFIGQAGGGLSFTNVPIPAALTAGFVGVSLDQVTTTGTNVTPYAEVDWNTY